MYRDPRDAIISLYEMYRERTHRSNLNPELFLELYDPIGQFRWEFDSWIKKNPTRVMSVKYEDLKTDPKEGFRRIFDYIGIASSVDPSAINTPVNQVEQNSNRPRRAAYGWKSAPAEYQPLIEHVSEALFDEIRYLNYEPSAEK